MKVAVQIIFILVKLLDKVRGLIGISVKFKLPVE